MLLGIMSNNISLYCSLFECEHTHTTVSNRMVSQKRAVNYQEQVIASYNWIFGGLVSDSSLKKAYYDLPLSEWLEPLKKTQVQRVSVTNNGQDADDS
jgi:hypothetical protein